MLELGLHALALSDLRKMESKFNDITNKSQDFKELEKRIKKAEVLFKFVLV